MLTPVVDFKSKKMAILLIGVSFAYPLPRNDLLIAIVATAMEAKAMLKECQVG